jgi:hypothetical protein
MGAKMQDRNNVTYLKLKAKTSDSDPTPFFGKTEKKNDKWEVTEKYNSVDGHLKGIEYSSYEYEGETKWKVSMKLVDPDGTITQLESNFNGLIYGILNALRGCKPDLIEINVWLGKAKVINGKEGKRYASAGVLNNGEKIGWHVPYDQLPQPEKVSFKGKTVTDDTAVVEYWKNVIDSEIKPSLNTEMPEQSSNRIQPNPTPSGGIEEPEERGGKFYGLASPPSDDLPFAFNPNLFKISW